MNIFIKPIIHRKKRLDIKSYIEYRKLLKFVKKTSPSFDQMVAISDFLTILREVYMYGNDDKFHLFLSTYPRGYTRLNCCSMIYKDKNFSITFLLFKESRTISIKITRKGQNGSDNEEISFEDDTYKFKDKYDEEKFLFITSCLMSGVDELIRYYYKNKKF